MNAYIEHLLCVSPCPCEVLVSFFFFFYRIDAILGAMFMYLNLFSNMNLIYDIVPMFAKEKVPQESG